MTKIKGKGKGVSSVLITETEIKSMSQTTQSRSSSGKLLFSHEEQGDSEREERSRAGFDISGSSGNHSYFNQDEFSILPEELQLVQFFSTKIMAQSSITRIPMTFGMASAGTPKAAEWLVVFTIYLPLILLPHWKRVETKKPHITK
ncbi:hypothetical protein O181_052495 [Austropuccinia psidii MF-1]|uniref:Uncharacterized protein n=1 Tax=Austropuccinia psidii MF-1 TaxID=1389203 RepID=A0A9Q3E514_9BASI|nr:hypothetical protein [Austropuccinia psidii MF-1]